MRALSLRRFAHDQSGANALEYALVMILVAFAIVTGATLLGTNLNSLFNQTGTAISAITVPSL